MKYLLKLLLIFPLFFTLNIEAAIIMKAGTVVACSTVTDETLTSYTTTASTASDVYVNQYIGQQFVVAGSGSYTITEVDVYMAWYFAGAAETVTVRIETDDTDSPSGTLLDANATKQLTRASFPEAAADDCDECTAITFTFPATFTGTYGTKYWVVVTSDANAANDYEIMNSGDGTGYAYLTKYSGDQGSSWSVSANDKVFVVRGCP